MTSTKAAVLGGADGLVSISGVIAAGAAQHVSHQRVGLIAVAGALSATVSMAGAELLPEESTDWAAVVAMGVGTLLGAALPAVPLLAVGGTAGWVAVVAVSVALAVVVGEVRARMTSSARSRAYGLTLAVLALGAAVGFGAGLA
jgi:VIT1/CCC1 family predicted Fe2+/Mn2+ transporter